MSYISDFLRLKCSGDILNIVNPVQKLEKEISESMPVIQRMKDVILQDPMKYTLYDLCAGNALTSIISTFLLPIKEAHAYDIKPRNRKWHLAKRFEYHTEDIFDMSPDMFDENSIITGIHACTSRSKRIIELFNKSKASYLFLMPCCIGTIEKDIPILIKKTLGHYLTWCYYLYEICNGKKALNQCNNCLSPVNCIISSRK